MVQHLLSESGGESSHAAHTTWENYVLTDFGSNRLVELFLERIVFGYEIANNKKKDGI